MNGSYVWGSPRTDAKRGLAKEVKRDNPRADIRRGLAKNTKKGKGVVRGMSVQVPKKERQSNFELLRILMMCTIPVYHLMIYNGVFFSDYNANVGPGLLLSAWTIAGDYAYVALSAYFFLEAKRRPVISKFLSFGAMVLTLYVIKIAVLRGLYGHQEGNYFLEDFLIKGSWWFAYGYLALLLAYPLLNRVIFSVSLKRLRAICLVPGILFTINGMLNNVWMGNDLLAFSFAYFYLGYQKRTGFQRLLGLRGDKKRLVFFVGICYIGTVAFSWYAKLPGVMEDSVACEIIRRLIGKYSIIQFFMGMALFMLFSQIQIRHSRRINVLAKSTVFVFLLHETVLGVFWHFGKVDGQFRFYPLPLFLGWTLLYLLVCFGVGIVAQKLYALLLEPFYDKLIQAICTWKIVQRLEDWFVRQGRDFERT